MAETQIYAIGTSSAVNIASGGETTYKWGTYSPWFNFKKPVAASTKKMKLDSKKLKKATKGASKLVGLGEDKTVYGTKIPKTAQAIIDGAEHTVRVRYQQRGYTIYKKIDKKHMKKMVYTKDKPYQYRLQYENKKDETTKYSEYKDDVRYIFFDNHYYDDDLETEIDTVEHLPHPQTCDFSYYDVVRNLDTSTSIASDGRDNKGSYALSFVRPNVVSLDLKWEGVTEEQGMEIIGTLNPTTKEKYIRIQYLDPATTKVKNGIFVVGERTIKKYPNGAFKEIACKVVEA